MLIAGVLLASAASSSGWSVRVEAGLGHSEIYDPEAGFGGYDSTQGIGSFELSLRAGWRSDGTEVFGEIFDRELFPRTSFIFSQKVKNSAAIDGLCFGIAFHGGWGLSFAPAFGVAIVHSLTHLAFPVTPHGEVRGGMLLRFTLSKEWLLGERLAAGAAVHFTAESDLGYWVEYAPTVGAFLRFF